MVFAIPTKIIINVWFKWDIYNQKEMNKGDDTAILCTEAWTWTMADDVKQRERSRIRLVIDTQSFCRQDDRTTQEFLKQKFQLPSHPFTKLQQFHQLLKLTDVCRVQVKPDWWSDQNDQVQSTWTYSKHQGAELAWLPHPTIHMRKYIAWYW